MIYMHPTFKGSPENIAFSIGLQDLIWTMEVKVPPFWRHKGVVAYDIEQSLAHLLSML